MPTLPPFLRQAASVALTAFVFTVVGAATRKTIEAAEEYFGLKKEDEDETTPEVEESLL